MIADVERAETDLDELDAVAPAPGSEGVAPPEAAEPELVVIDASTRVRRRSRRAIGVALLVLGVMFAGVLLQLSLMSGQRELDSLRNELETARLHQEQQRRDESMLQSPEGIIEVATDDLGMVPAEDPAVVVGAPRIVAPIPEGATP